MDFILSTTRTAYRLYAVLALGDLAVFFLFAFLGRADHQASLAAPEILRAMAPFAIFWFLLSPWLGAYRERWLASQRAIWRRTLLAWLVCGVVALVARSLVYDRPLLPAFALVALSFQGAFLVLWRVAFARWLYRRLAP